jgi:tetratricopeptide (TPR) repeat protein
MGATAAIEVHRALERARDIHHEDHDAALAEAIRCHEVARGLEDPGLRCRALVLQAAVMLQRGDLQGAVALTTEADPFAEAADDDSARAELAAVKGQLNFFAGSYPESLAQAERAIALSDRVGSLALRVFTRRCACVVFGNIGVSDWHGKLQEVLELAIEADNPWEEAMSRNDLAHLTMEQGRLDEAERDIGRAMAIAAPLAPLNTFALAVLSCTRSEVRLRAGRAEAALADAQTAVDLLTADGEPNPYLLAMSVVVEVQALLALGRLDEAERTGQRAVERLGDRVPQARSMILSTVAEACARPAGSSRPTTSCPPASPSSAPPSPSCRRCSAGSSAPRSRPRPRATRPSATGSPGCTTAATSPASSSATRRRRAPARSASRCSTSITSRTSTTATATTPATRSSCASPRCCSAACADRTSSCAPAARSSCS